MRRATCLFQVQRFREGNLRTWIGKMRYSTHSSSDHIRMGPAVRMLLLRNNLDADNIEASGPKGSLLKGDVLSFLENGRKGEISLFTLILNLIFGFFMYRYH